MDGASKHSSLPLWKLYVDGSSTDGGGGASLILISPDGTPLKYAVKLHFTASNNEAEYEALLSGLRLAIEMEAQHLLSYCDSQLIVNQVKGEFKAKGTKMKEYLAIARALAAVTPPTRHSKWVSGEGVTLRDCDSLTFSFSI